MSVAVIKGRLNAVENFSKFFQETAETVEKEMHDAPAQFEAEVKANTPNEPMERELFAKTFSIGGSKFEFVQFRFKRGNKNSKWLTVGSCSTTKKIIGNKSKKCNNCSTRFNGVRTATGDDDYELGCDSVRRYSRRSKRQ